jgi:hypothetical protein
MLKGRMANSDQTVKGSTSCFDSANLCVRFSRYAHYQGADRDVREVALRFKQLTSSNTVSQIVKRTLNTE